MPAATLDRRTLNRTLLERQGLLRRERSPVASVLSHLVGMQSQVPANPFLALWSRIDGFDPSELDGLMSSRAAVRTGLMRTTLHLVTATDALALRPLFADVLARVLTSQRAFREGLDGLDLAEVAGYGADLLGGEPMTAAQLRPLLSERWPDRDPAVLMMAVRYLVPVVQAPPRGLWQRSSQPALVTLDRWLDRPIPRRGDVESLVLRYLAAFGPASVSDLRTWSWLTDLRAVVERLRPRLRTYRDDSGRELLDLEDGVIVEGDREAPPRFLPEYDNLFLSHQDRSRIVDAWYDEDRYSRGKLLVDGFVIGGWRIDESRDEARLIVDLFRDLSSSERVAVEEEANEVLAFLVPGAERRMVDLVPSAGAPAPRDGGMT